MIVEDVVREFPIFIDEREEAKHQRYQLKNGIKWRSRPLNSVTSGPYQFGKDDDIQPANGIL